MNIRPFALVAALLAAAVTGCLSSKRGDAPLTAAEVDALSGEQLTEITLSEKLCRRHPKFLKVNKGSVYTGFCTAEIELRLVREPGLAIIVR